MSHPNEGRPFIVFFSFFVISAFGLLPEWELEEERGEGTGVEKAREVARDRSSERERVNVLPFTGMPEYCGTGGEGEEPPGGEGGRVNPEAEKSDQERVERFCVLAYTRL